MTKAVIEICLPLKLPSVANLREHWTTKARRTKTQRHIAGIRTLSALRLAGQQRGTVDRAWVTMTRISTRPIRDGDNLQASCKAVRDGIADALGVDDADPRIDWGYAQRKGVSSVEVRISFDEPTL
jgi:crossover junction endodeoxyribonuclease RusA